MKKILTIVFLFVAIGMGFAQAPPNDECVNAINIPLPLPYSSAGLGFTNVNATPSTPLTVPTGPAVPNWISPGVIQRDVWFEFTTPAGANLDIILDITANCPNTFVKYALYKGNCSILITQGQGPGLFATGVGPGTGTVSTPILGLDPGTQYFLRIDNGILPAGVPGNAPGCPFVIDINPYCAPVNMANGSSNFCNDA